MKEIVRAERLIKDYRVGDVTVHALRGIDFSVGEGELVVILGPSGSGKSTTMNLLGGIETATSGDIFYEGKRLDWADPKSLTAYRRKHIGFIFQFYNLLPGLTALENIELAAELGSDPLDPEMLLERVGLGDRGNHFPGKLSGGEQQRVAIARAICKNPDLLLCDEPTGALDSRTGVQVLELICDFCREYRKPVVMVTHNRTIAQMADRVFYFKDGQIERAEENPAPRRPDEIIW